MDLLLPVHPPLGKAAPSASMIMASSPFQITVVKREVTCAVSFLLLTIISSFFLFDFLRPFQYQPISKVSGFFSQYLPGGSTNDRSGLLRREDEDDKKQQLLQVGCDYSVGRWVREEASALRFYDEDCPFLDPGFRCRRSGRRDVEYLNWRWQPDGCDLPRFNASDFLERSRNGRVVFAGDSIGRNQWESLICMLAQAVSNKSAIYEVNGNPITKHKGFLRMRFDDYNLTVEYYRMPYLVVTDRPPKDAPEVVKYAIRLDKLHWYSKLWAGADLLLVNDGHWWNAGKTTDQGFYFQEGDTVNMTMEVEEAFRRSLQTWKTWVMENLDPMKTHVAFRSYSPVHYRHVYRNNTKVSKHPQHI
uniref:Trichome birefringence-like N-terminal domain-containing protein n=1 Tax=Kalanchoe fedtschenkoi TaxID=63787 RepID=A0A7N0ULS2_KALFE